MQIKQLPTYVIAAVLLLVLFSLGFGAVLGHPVLLTYVETGSMEPTLNQGDGFIAIPTVLSGEIELGDVVVFQAEALHGGEITTHRVVHENPNGYVTQGDANPFPDQSMGEPLVTDGQIKATALTINGDVVRIPHLGTVAMATNSGIDSVERTVAAELGVQRLGSQQLAYVLLGIGLLAFAGTLLSDAVGRRDRSRDRSRTRTDYVDTRYLFAASVLLLCAAATIGMLDPAGTETIGIISTQGDSSVPTIIPVGETDSYEAELHNGGLLPTVSYFEPRSEGIEIDPKRVRLGAQQSANMTVTLHAPDETGYYVRSMTEYRYLEILPPAVIERLYHVHPWTPYLAINGALGTMLVAFWVGFRGSLERRVLPRKTSRTGPRSKRS